MQQGGVFREGKPLLLGPSADLAWKPLVYFYHTCQES